MTLTRNIDGVLHIYYALFDINQTGEYEDDILYHAWLTEDEAKARNAKFREAGTEGLHWYPDDVEQEEHEDSPSLDMDLHY